MRRLRRIYGREGAAGLVSKRRGKPSNHHLPYPMKEQVLARVQACYPDFGPTLAVEHLRGDGYVLSKETLRVWMIEAGLWQAAKGRRQSLQPPRPRRPRMGELLQIDGSPHRWLEERGSRCTLIAFIDDATSRVMLALFVSAETTHHHGDHVLGNIVFQGAEVISSEICRDMVSKTGDEWVALVESLISHKLPNTRPVPATLTFAGENMKVERTIQGVKLVFWVPLGSHTVGDMMVYLPDDKVLVGGDILENRTIPVMRNALVKNWVCTLEMVQNFDATTIVPGHGPLMTKSDVAELQRQMAGFYSGVETGYKKGLSDSETRKTLELTEWKKREGFDTNIGGNVNRTYLEIEQASF